MIRWRVASVANLAPPAAAALLLEQVIERRPTDAALRLKLADLSLDRFDFGTATNALEIALRLDPALPGVRQRLARCYNALARHPDALDALAVHQLPEFERAFAWEALGLTDEAEAELRAVLEVDPHHLQACRQLCKLLRKAGRTAELLELCEALAARGVSHAQLLYVWGTALALEGEHERARAILFDRERVAELRLPVPDGFADHAQFNAALADEILTNPHRLSDFPAEHEANRGSSRVHALLAGRRPDLISGLLESLQELADAWTPPRYGSFDPWVDARPAAAHLRAWGLIQRGGEYEDWHLHRGGWISGVYYVRVPKGVSAGGEGRGCIEYGPPTALERALPGYLPVWRHAPREGSLLLAPSHYAHRTIPSGLDEYRISFAFDVVPRTEVEAG